MLHRHLTILSCVSPFAKQSHSQIGHLRDSKSADAIGAQLAKLPHKIPNEPNFLLSIPDIVRLYEI